MLQYHHKGHPRPVRWGIPRKPRMVRSAPARLRRPRLARNRNPRPIHALVPSPRRAGDHLPQPLPNQLQRPRCQFGNSLHLRVQVRIDVPPLRPHHPHPRNHPRMNQLAPVRNRPQQARHLQRRDSQPPLANRQLQGLPIRPVVPLIRRRQRQRARLLPGQVDPRRLPQPQPVGPVQQWPTPRPTGCVKEEHIARTGQRRHQVDFAMPYPVMLERVAAIPLWRIEIPQARQGLTRVDKPFLQQRHRTHNLEHRPRRQSRLGRAMKQRPPRIRLDRPPIDRVPLRQNPRVKPGTRRRRQHLPRPHVQRHNRTPRRLGLRSTRRRVGPALRQRSIQQPLRPLLQLQRQPHHHVRAVTRTSAHPLRKNLPPPVDRQPAFSPQPPQLVLVITLEPTDPHPIPRLIVERIGFREPLSPLGQKLLRDRASPAHHVSRQLS